jgi:hypothetical protein
MTVVEDSIKRSATKDIGLHTIAIDTIATPEVPKVTVVFVEGFVGGSPAEAAKNEGNICIGDVLTEVNGSIVRALPLEQVAGFFEGVAVVELKFTRDEALLNIFRQWLSSNVKEEAEQSQDDASASIELASIA